SASPAVGSAAASPAPSPSAVSWSRTGALRPCSVLYASAARQACPAARGFDECRQQVRLDTPVFPAQGRFPSLSRLSLPSRFRDLDRRTSLPQSWFAPRFLPMEDRWGSRTRRLFR